MPISKTTIGDRPAGPAARPMRVAGRRRTTLIRAAMAAAIVLGAGSLFGAVAASANDPAADAGPVVGAPAPGLILSTIDGRVVDLAGLRGRPVWLTFGASWCQACRAENPDIEAAFEAATGGDLALIAVFISEDSATVADYARLTGLTYEKVADPDRELADRYRVVGLPTHFFIDRRGVVREVRVGSLDPDGIRQALAAILR